MLKTETFEDILVSEKIVFSKNEARRLAASNAIKNMDTKKIITDTRTQAQKGTYKIGKNGFSKSCKNICGTKNTRPRACFSFRPFQERALLLVFRFSVRVHETLVVFVWRSVEIVGIIFCPDYSTRAIRRLATKNLSAGSPAPSSASANENGSEGNGRNQPSKSSILIVAICFF